MLKDSKVAGGMEVCYTIRFTPQEVKDYSCALTVRTEREQFVVPVMVLGERPLLQVPVEVSKSFALHICRLVEQPSLDRAF